MKIRIRSDRFEANWQNEIELEGDVFGYAKYGDDYHPNHMVFVDTSAHDQLFESITKNFDPCSDWGKLLGLEYKKDPTLEKRLSYETMYNIPDSAIYIPHSKSGGHGDIRLKYRRASLIFMPLKDYYTYLKKDHEFIDDCKVLNENGEYIKGNESITKGLGVELEY